jgi:DNA-binding MarR family transcriptional regulator
MPSSVFNLDEQNANVDSRIVAALERISTAFRVLLWNECKEYSLSPIQVQVLIFLLYHVSDKTTISYLSKEFNLTKPTISDAVKSLEQKELIRKKTSTDTRSYTIYLTPKGKSIAQNAASFANEIKNPVERLSAQQKESLLLGLTGVIQHLNKAGIVTVQRMCQTCIHYKTNHKGHAHFCSLVKAGLEFSDLRIDCPEHQAALAEEAWS